MGASSGLVRRSGSVAALALIAVAGVAASAVQTRNGAAVTGEVAYTRVSDDAQPRMS